jgi:hypothetical protein
MYYLMTTKLQIVEQIFKQILPLDLLKEVFKYIPPYEILCPKDSNIALNYYTRVELFERCPIAITY